MEAHIIYIYSFFFKDQYFTGRNGLPRNRDYVAKRNPP